MSAQSKKIDTACFYRFPKFQPTRKWVNKVTQNLFQIRACVLAREKQNILLSQPYLHTLMQTLLSANQSARTILVIL